jgi:hypothetical protein
VVKLNFVLFLAAVSSWGSVRTAAQTSSNRVPAGAYVVPAPKQYRGPFSFTRPRPVVVRRAIPVAEPVQEIAASRKPYITRSNIAPKPTPKGVVKAKVAAPKVVAKAAPKVAPKPSPSKKPVIAKSAAKSIPTSKRNTVRNPSPAKSTVRTKSAPEPKRQVAVAKKREVEVRAVPRRSDVVDITPPAPRKKLSPSVPPTQLASKGKTNEKEKTKAATSTVPVRVAPKAPLSEIADTKLIDSKPATPVDAAQPFGPAYEAPASVSFVNITHATYRMPQAQAVVMTDSEAGAQMAPVESPQSVSAGQTDVPPPASPRSDPEKTAPKELPSFAPIAEPSIPHFDLGA